MNTTMSLQEQILHGHICPYCHRPSELVDSKLIYSSTRSYGQLYACIPCNAWVGTHTGSTKALGRLANAELRALKVDAHSFFDHLWLRKMKKANISKQVARNMAYEWLAQVMGVEKEFCHIGMFDKKQCLQVVALCKPFFNQYE